MPRQSEPVSAARQALGAWCGGGEEAGLLLGLVFGERVLYGPRTASLLGPRRGSVWRAVGATLWPEPDLQPARWASCYSDTALSFSPVGEELPGRAEAGWGAAAFFKRRPLSLGASPRQQGRPWVGPTQAEVSGDPAAASCWSGEAPADSGRPPTRPRGPGGSGPFPRPGLCAPAFHVLAVMPPRTRARHVQLAREKHRASVGWRVPCSIGRADRRPGRNRVVSPRRLNPVPSAAAMRRNYKQLQNCLNPLEY